MPPPPTKSGDLLTKDEIDWLETKILNDKLGLKLNFTELDYEEQKNYFLLEEKSDLNINVKDGQNHLIIEGDNYHALKALKTAGVKVNIICIDPPYNTGKEFIYNDDYATNPRVVTGEDPHKHSKWLSFMKKRLLIAQELLSDDGAIFVFIDDNERFYLKVIMDEIFDESNFIASFIWEKTYSPKNNNKFASTNHDYILCFAKDKRLLSHFNRLKRTAKNNALYKHDDHDGRGLYRLDNLTVEGQQGYDIEWNGLVFSEPSTTGWRFGKDKMYKLIKDNRIYLPSDPKKRPQFKRYLSEVQDVVSKTILPWQLVGHTDSNQKELDDILGGRYFKYPKGTKLMKYLIQLVPDNEQALVLDFFAGSGTTAHAVMALNQADGGNRRFIMVNNSEACNEKTNVKIRKQCEIDGYHTIDATRCTKNICQKVCRERIYRVIEGCGSNEETIKWKYSKSQKSLTDNHVRYLKVKYLDQINGHFEELDKVKSLYKNEFQKKLTARDLRD